MKNVLTKKGVLALSLVGIAWWLFLFLTNSILFSTGGHCHMYYVGWCNFASKTIEHTVAYTNPFFPLFLLSLITYFMREEVFRSWVRFAAWWIPISMVLIFITPTENGSFGFPSLTSPGFTAFILSALFLIISLFFILWKRADVEDKKERARK